MGLLLATTSKGLIEMPLTFNYTPLFPDDAFVLASPNAGLTRERADLHRRFADRVSVNPYFSRKIVSYQGNKESVGFRWMKYKEGFSTALIRQLIQSGKGTQILDPFSGIGTTALTAMSMGLPGTGIEILHLGNIVAHAVAYAANRLSVQEFYRVSQALLHTITNHDYDAQYALRTCLKVI